MPSKTAQKPHFYTILKIYFIPFYQIDEDKDSPNEQCLLDSLFQVKEQQPQVEGKPRAIRARVRRIRRVPSVLRLETANKEILLSFNVIVPVPHEDYTRVQ